MIIIEIQALPNGAHRNQTVSGAVAVPAGWAAIPADVSIPETFPFVDVVTSGGKIVSLRAREVPAPEPEHEPEPTETEQLRADVDFLAAMAGVTL